MTILERVPTRPPTTRRSVPSLNRLTILAGALVCLTIATRLPVLLHRAPIDDEAIYGVVANEIVLGGRPYVDAIERKPPLLFWTYTGVFEIAGRSNWTALHAVAIGWTLATAAALGVGAAKLFGPEAGFAAALLYSIFQPWGTYKNLAFNGELLMNLPIACAYAIAFWPRRTNRFARVGPRFAIAGALLGAAFLLKQPAAIAAVPLGVYVLLPSYRAAHGYTRAESLAQALALTIGFAGVLGVAVAILDRQGILREAYYWTITNHDLPHVFWDVALEHSAAFLVATLPLTAAAVVGLLDGGLWAEAPSERTAVILLLIASAVGVAAGGRFYPHYYIQLLPPLVFLAAPALARASRDPRRSPWLLRPHVAAVLTGIAVVVFTVLHVRGLARQPLVSSAGQYLRDHSAASDRIFVWGEDPQIYIDAVRRPASRYVSTFPLTGFIFGEPLPGVETRNRIVPGAWAKLARDFRRHPPAFIVDVRNEANAAYPARDFPPLAQLIADDYRRTAVIDDAVIYERSATVAPAADAITATQP
jgi:4-amino-4-deoxy-L-arabinose transferase-like glycosyltransferase